MSKDAVVLVGTKRFRKALKLAGVDLADLRMPYLGAAKKVASAAKPTAPRRTGALAATVRGTATRTAATVRAGNNSSVLYANPIHWGWMRRGIDENPWISVAAQRTEPSWLPLFMDELTGIMDDLGKDYT